MMERCLAAENEAGKPYEHPTWVQVLFGFLLGIPLGINQLIKWHAQNQARQNMIEEYINRAYQDLNETYASLINLKKIKICSLSQNCPLKLSQKKRR